MECIVPLATPIVQACRYPIKTVFLPCLTQDSRAEVKGLYGNITS